MLLIHQNNNLTSWNYTQENVFCQDLRGVYGNIDSKGKIALTIIFSSLGIIGFLSNSLVVICIHKTKQLDVQSIKLYRNFSVIDAFNSFVNFVHLKIILDPYQTECVYHYILRSMLHWTLFSSSFMIPVTAIDRYIHIKHHNNYATVFSPLRFKIALVLYFICSIIQSIVATVVVSLKGFYADLKYTMPLNFIFFVAIVFLHLRSIHLLKKYSMASSISSSKRNIVKIASMYFYFYLCSVLIILIHPFVTSWLRNSIDTDLSVLSVNRTIYFSVTTFMAIGNAMTFLWINQKCRNLLKSVLWIRGQVIRESSLGFKGPEFDPSVRRSVVKIANHC